MSPACSRIYNRRMTAEPTPAVRLSADNDFEIEARQVRIWRSLSTVEIAALVNGASRAARAFALAGLRQRHPSASERELVARLAVITLGAPLARRVYPELAQLDL